MFKWIKTCYYGALMFYFYRIDITGFENTIDFVCVSVFLFVFAVIPMVVMVSSKLNVVKLYTKFLSTKQPSYLNMVKTCTNKYVFIFMKSVKYKSTDNYLLHK